MNLSDEVNVILLLMVPMKVLIVDNNDSFTYNLWHLVRPLVSGKADVMAYDEVDEKKTLGYDKIILSPGPGVPEDFPAYATWLDSWKTTKSVLGICMGHEIIHTHFGGKLRPMKHILHGVSKSIQVESASSGNLFAGLGPRIEVGLYHSWVIDETCIPEILEILARDEEGHVMAIRHREYDITGVQFHPESYMTAGGTAMIANWLGL